MLLAVIPQGAHCAQHQTQPDFIAEEGARWLIFLRPLPALMMRPIFIACQGCFYPLLFFITVES